MSPVARPRATEGPPPALVELRRLGIGARDASLVHDVDLDVRPGRVTALMGPSGSGKTLTARAIMGQVDPGLRLESGTLRFPVLDGRDWYEGVRRQGDRAQRRLLVAMAELRGSYMSYSPQAAASALNPGRTLGRQLLLALRRRREPPADPGAEIRELLVEVGLEPRAAGALPGELSGGMCQRAALAIAVAPEPRLVIADEPETGLDPVLTRVITELLLSLCRVRGAGLLLISHHQETVDRIADEVVRLPGPEERPA